MPKAIFDPAISWPIAVKPAEPENVMLETDCSEPVALSKADWPKVILDALDSVPVALSVELEPKLIEAIALTSAAGE